MARQRAWTRHLGEVDACTKYFHLQACHRRRKNYLLTITHEGLTFSEEQAKAGVVYSYYNAIIGTPLLRQHRINLGVLQLPSLDLAELALPFSPAKVEAAVRASPSETQCIWHGILQNCMANHRVGCCLCLHLLVGHGLQELQLSQ
jgi:hypothetical protein